MSYLFINKIIYNNIISQIHIIRTCSKLSNNGKISYKNTLNLPKTKFPLSMKDGIVLKRELKLQKVNAY